MPISSALGSSALLPAGLGFRNVIINGDFRINQRGLNSSGQVGGSSLTNGKYGQDRWLVYMSDGTVTYSSQAFTLGNSISGYEPTNFARITTSGQTLASAFSALNQFIEGVRTFAGQQVTISFWAKASSGTPKVAVAMQQAFGSGGGSSAVNTPVSAVTISTSWTRYYVTTTVPSISGKTLGTGNDDYLLIHLITSAGSNNNTIASSIGIQNTTIDFWGVQVEQNYQPTPFEQRPIGVELQLCQRYYEKSFNLSVAPADGVYTNAYVSNVVYLDYWVLAINWVPFKVEKARVPDMSFFGSGGKWQASNSDNTWTTFAQAPTSAVQGVMGIKTTGFSLGIHNNGANGLNVVGYSRMVRGDWVASAEL